MEILIAVLLLILGLVLIIKGGDFFVDAATWMAEVSGIPKFIIGATVVSFATTLPELLTSVFAALQGVTDMAIGNAIGSVTANIGLIMAISLMAMPSVIKRSDYYVKIALMIGATLITVIFGLSGSFGTVPSILLLTFFVINIFENLRSGKKATKKTIFEKKPAHDKKTVTVNILKFVFGAAAIVFGADLLVDNGQIIARALNVSDRIISVTIIAIGTSLPELVTTVTAVIKKQSDLSVGNIIGANIIDLTLIMPVCGLITGSGLPVSNQIATVDFPACLIVGSIACIPTLIAGKFRRWQGVALLVCYLAYLTVTVFVVA